VINVKKYVILSSVLIITIVILLGFNAMMSSDDIMNQQQYITLDQFNQIEEGMTYEDVKQILQTSGELQSQSGDIDSNANIKIYTFSGQAKDSKAVVMLRGDKVISKSNIGLE
jgi:hypothetical protein